MPRGDYDETEKLALKIVADAERCRGWKPTAPLSQHRQRQEGCDLLSQPPGDGPPHRVEVKGWGEPLLRNGNFAYPADVNAEQLDRAKTDPRWRLEVVGNLTAVRAGQGEPQRLTLTGEEVAARAVGWRFRVPLDGLEDRIEP